MPTQEDDWSDSNQEELSDVETPVLLRAYQLTPAFLDAYKKLFQEV
jgi:hypothetical protein